MEETAVKRIGYVPRALLVALAMALLAGPAAGVEISADTQRCLACHRTATPGIVADWERSLHAVTTPNQGTAKPPLERRVSAPSFPGELGRTVVGCAECHTINADRHPDSFDHNGFRLHTVVSPRDCAVCHPEEERQYGRNIMSQAHGNLNNNPVYHDMAAMSNGTQKFDDGKLAVVPPSAETTADSCNSCHGTVVTFEGTVQKQSPFGPVNVSRLSGWPNQGVGRINPDGTKGSCTSCHPRHQFAIEVARKPATCSQCHKGPDVPAYAVYVVSKHSNIYESLNKGWNFKAVPWTVGEDFTAPTCATCHASLVVSRTGEVLGQRTHQFNDRSVWRIFGLPYAHPHPADPDTTKIRNKAGLPLPTELTGEPASAYLIDAKEQAKRRSAMKGICAGCHGSEWIDRQFERFDKTVKEMNDKTLTATRIMLEAWEEGLARGLADGDSLFNEALEKKWVESWLFYANSTRFASAMMGADYGVFANGRWYMNKNTAEMADWLEILEKTHGREKKEKKKR